MQRRIVWYICEVKNPSKKLRTKRCTLGEIVYQVSAKNVELLYILNLGEECKCVLCSRTEGWEDK